MTWQELADFINNNMPKDERGKRVKVFDYSINNNPFGDLMYAKSIEPWDFNENPQQDFSICFNSEDWF